ncbi:hypothetical protein HG535_0F00310 [Zygotorulaspora mrakii]|uniref:Actin-binding protein n=1 Tax=Zygotorulaspora mrakii TaxID=42260 RepID=A0A7H9B4A3_ZYGMR|nr:uncharacterized protein HG535_0F00310 [Zygotorulaspora mrakii]QLG73521.1 hypothetical protein HG535_0F00310 [Zygotorulaspora mrakii]
MALEPINYTTYSREIEQEYLKVVRGVDEDTTWLIISPNTKKEYTPEYVGSDFSEFLSMFEETKVQFGLARVSPPGSDVKKLILIGWCPDLAPLKMKASFAANFGTVANQLLKGYHIQVTARDEDDLDEAELLQKISNASGARYSIQMNDKKPVNRPANSNRNFAKPVPGPAPQRERNVGTEAASPVTAASNVKSTSAGPPQPTKKPVSNDVDDWDEPEVEERDFHEKPLKPSASSYRPVGKIDLQKVIAEEKAREDPRLVSAMHVSKKIAPQDDITNLKEQSKLKRDQEMSAFLGTKPLKAGPAPQKNDDMTIKGFKNEKTPAQLWVEKKAAEAAAASGSKSTLYGNLQQEQEPQQSKSDVQDYNEEADVNDLKSKFEKLSSNAEPAIITPKRVDETPIPKEDVYTAVKSDTSQFGRPLPGMHVEVSNEENEEVDEEDEWDEEEASPAPALPSRSSYISQEEKQKQPIQKEEPVEEEPVEEEPVEEEPVEEEPAEEEPAEEEPIEEEPPSLPLRNFPPPPARKSVEPTKPALPSAIATYDYEAGEENELTFKENDRIIHIDFVDEDWWLGELEETGEKGLFPSNYITLEN